jgi:hypothetical protein
MDFCTIWGLLIQIKSWNHKIVEKYPFIKYFYLQEKTLINNKVTKIESWNSKK